MHARISEYQIQPNKRKGFVNAVESVLPKLRKQEGFRALLVLSGSQKDSSKAIIVSVWDSLADMRANEKNLFLYQALSRVMMFSQGMPRLSEHEVWLTEFSAD